MGKPLSVALTAITKDDKVLLLKRERGNYQGFWALPGGKVEEEEHLSEAAEREVLEETNLETDFKEHQGLVSEHLIEEGEITQHFLLHFCMLEPKHTEHESGDEGRVEWFDLDSLESEKENIIPSDYAMIETFLKQGRKGYFDCILNKKGNGYEMEKFEEIGK